MRSQKVNCMFIILVSIVLLGPVQGAEDDDDDYKEPIEEYLEEDIAAGTANYKMKIHIHLSWYVHIILKCFTEQIS